MPLSEDEQRILRQIERELEQDPTFAHRGYRVPRRRAIMLGAGVVAGTVLTIGALSVNYVLAFVGFLFVLLMAVLLEEEIRLIGRERIGQLPISAWLSGHRRANASEDDD